MSRLLYGSSNVYRHFSRAPSGLGLDLELIECTRKPVFDAHVASLGKLQPGSLVVTSVLENFIVEGCKDLGLAEVPLFAHQQITAHVESLASMLRDSPDSIAIVVPPIRRNLPDWFPTHLPSFITFLSEEVERLDIQALHVAVPFVVADTDELEADQIHLKSIVGDRFLTSITQSVSSVLSSASEVTLVGDDTVTMEEEVTIESEAPGDRLAAILRIVQGNSLKLNVVRPLKASLDQLAENTSVLETQVRLRRKQDNLIFARIKEESDTEVNRSREDRVVISGLDRASSGLTSHAEKKEYYSRVVTSLIASACPDMDPKPVVVDVFVTLRREQAKPSVEVRLDSPSAALAFRKAASALAKANNGDFSSLFFSNSATHATSVRVEIMRQIAKKLTTETEVAFVHGFLSRPVLRYEVKESCHSYCSGTGRSYNFVDSVSRFGDLLMASDLAPAYKRAGDTFRGAMEQYFILLVEGGAGRADANQQPLGTPSRRGRGGRRGGRGGFRRPGGSLQGRSGVKRTGEFGSPDEPHRKKNS